jgi:uncharacterized protein YtpQ (UPF0354 family)
MAEPTIPLSKEDSPVLFDLRNGLVVSYVLDQGGTLEYISYRDLELSGLRVGDLHSAAVRNLLEHVSKKTRVQPVGSIHAVFVDGNFEASLILLDEVWKSSFRPFVKGQYAVAIPARDMLAFGDASSPDALNDLAAVIGNVFPDGDHLISDRVFVRVDQSWKVRTANAR